MEMQVQTRAPGADGVAGGLPTVRDDLFRGTFLFLWGVTASARVKNFHTKKTYKYLTKWENQDPANWTLSAPPTVALPTHLRGS